MSSCKYARKVGDEYEFGVVEIHTIKKGRAKSGEPAFKEERVHVPIGTKPSLEEALNANEMALEGQRRRRFFVQ